MHSIETFMDLLKRGKLELPPFSQYKGTVKLPISPGTAQVYQTFDEPYEDPVTGEIIYRQKRCL